MAYNFGSEFSMTTFEYTNSGNELVFTINSMNGDFDGKPSKRQYQIQLVGVYPAVSVSVNGKDIKAATFTLYNTKKEMTDASPDTFGYDGETLSLVINLNPKSVNDKVVIKVVSIIAAGFGHVDLCSMNFNRAVSRLFKTRDLLDNEWGKPIHPFQVRETKYCS